MSNPRVLHAISCVLAGLILSTPLVQAGEGVFAYVNVAGQASEARKYVNWRESWEAIVAGRFHGDCAISDTPRADDLLLYDKAAGQGEIYALGGSASMSRVRTFPMSSSLTLLAPASFNRDCRTDLMAFDREHCEVIFYTTGEDGTLTELRRHPAGMNWTAMVPGHVNNDTYSDFLFYDRPNGTIEIRTTDETGNMSVLRRHPGQPTTYDVIISTFLPGQRYSAFLAYDKAAKQLHVFTTDGRGGLTKLVTHDFVRVWDSLASGIFFGDGMVLFYDRTSGYAEVHQLDRSGALHLQDEITLVTYAQELVLPVKFETTLPVTQFLFYNKRNSEAERFLLSHNQYRRRHGVPELTWSDDLAVTAKAAARNCIASHSEGAENWAKGFRDTIERAVQRWYSEESRYDYADPPANFAEFVEQDTGHFTQIVWNESRRLGCGFAACEGDSFKTSCIYARGGNVLSQFEENVFPPLW